jgi:hypothetical protein
MLVADDSYVTHARGEHARQRQIYRDRRTPGGHRLHTRRSLAHFQSTAIHWQRRPAKRGKRGADVSRYISKGGHFALKR